jgi:LPPG:FO 2-phospho-L-lactate transferase
MITTLAGGVGGARFADGLIQAAGADNVTVVVNTADDFELYGLRICPDLDTVLYTLAGIANPELGWGIAGDTRATLDGIAAFGEEPWFQLGDRDFATHVLRTAWLRDGNSLETVVDELRRRLGVPTPIVPMTSDPVATTIETPSGWLAFQDYFVRRRQQDDVIGVSFVGIEEAKPAESALAAVRNAGLIMLAPSNPIVSIGPILAFPPFHRALSDRRAPAVAISPIIGGRALKGPADRMLQSLGHEPTATGVARLYEGLIDGFVIDHVDADQAPEIEQELGISVFVTDAIMHEIADRGRLAREAMAFGESLRVKATA